MEKVVNQRLCGGTFFTLLLEARKLGVGSREHYNVKNVSLTETDTLIGLIKIIVPEYNENKLKPESFKVFTTNYKSCKKSTTVNVPFGDELAIKAFDKRVRDNYQNVVVSMGDFISTFIEVGGSTKRDSALVKALLELIEFDDSIEDNQAFYINNVGGKVFKSDFHQLNEVCMESFLLGIWHFILLHRKDNTIGKDTFNLWCPANGGGKRKYNAKLGETSARTIMLKHVIGQGQNEVDEIDLKLDINNKVRKCPISSEDLALLCEFKSDWTPIIEYCLMTDFSENVVNIKILIEIEILCNEKWCFRSKGFIDANLRKLKNDIITTFNELMPYLSDKYLRLHGVTGYLIARNQSLEEGERLREELRPNTIRIRNKLYELYLELYPDQDAVIEPTDSETGQIC